MVLVKRIITRISVFIVSIEKEIKEGKSPAIRVSERKWNDESSGISINMENPVQVCFFTHKFYLIF